MDRARPAPLRAFAERPEFFGVLDAGLASLATFLVGLYAARALDPVQLGAYALCFRAAFLAGMIPSHRVFLPAENISVALPQGQRLGLLRHSLRLGAGTAAACAVAVALWIFLAPPSIPGSSLLALTVTAIAAAFLSPVQDHVRRMLHLSGASRTAALVSTVQLTSVTVVVLAALALGVSPWWVPFGALAVANLLSLGVGTRAVARAVEGDGSAAVLRPEEIRRSGRWLVVLAVLDAGAAFAAAALVAGIAGSAALGYAEAARLVAHPVLVLAWGLGWVLGPRSVRAAQQRHAAEARSVSRRFTLLLGAAGAAALAVFGLDWWGNPMGWLLPKAYVVPGLVALSITAHLAAGMVYPLRAELVGARLERFIANVDLRANVARTLLAIGSAAFQAYAVPLSLLGFGVAQWFGYQKKLRSMYRRDDLRPEAATVSVS